jgi:hypothetical protein
VDKKYEKNKKERIEMRETDLTLCNLIILHSVYLADRIRSRHDRQIDGGRDD